MDDTEVDPAMLEAMGFTAFGSKPGKKRKLNASEAFVDPTISGAQVQEQTLSSNDVQSSVETAQSNTESKQTSANQPASTSSNQIPPRSYTKPQADAAPRSFASDIDGDDKESLEALKNGVPNQYGDMVYFLPDFLDDPWERLKKS